VCFRNSCPSEDAENKGKENRGKEDGGREDQEFVDHFRFHFVFLSLISFSFPFHFSFPSISCFLSFLAHAPARWDWILPREWPLL
jgi:hypothetical protein